MVVVVVNLVRIESEVGLDGQAAVVSVIVGSVILKRNDSELPQLLVQLLHH